MPLLSKEEFMEMSSEEQRYILYLQNRIIVEEYLSTRLLTFSETKEAHKQIEQIEEQYSKTLKRR